MAGFGKSSRVGKRHGPPSSMSSFSYYATIVLFVGLCIVGVWMFTSSNVTPPQVTTFSRVSSSSSSSPHFKPGFSRIVAFRQPPPDPEEDSQSTLPEEGVQGDGDDEDDKSRQKIPSFIRPKRPDRESEGGENENRSGGEEESTSNEKSQEKKEDDEGTTTAGGDLNGGTEEVKRLSEEEIHEQHQREHDEQLPGGESENQQEPKQQPSEQIGCDNQEERVPDEQQPPPEQIDGDNQQIPDEQQPPPEQISGDNQQEQIPDEQRPPPEQIGGDKRHEQTPDEQQRQLDEQLPAGKGEDSQQEPRQQEQPQQARGDGREEQIPEEPQKQHDEQFPVGNGEDNLQEPQQPLQAGDDGEGTQQESQPEVVEENIQQVTDEDQQQTDSGEQPVEVGGGSDDQQQPASERLMEGNSTDSREENFEQQIEEKLDDPNGGESQGGNGKTAWATQAAHSDNEKERRKEEDLQSAGNGGVPEGAAGSSSEVEWKLCNDTTGPDYIPCLDNEKAIKKLRSFRHYQHRERHCPEESPTCLVPLPVGYRQSIEWPQSRDRIWYNNVPRTKLAEVKGHQNWVKVAGEYLTFPGGGTQFIHGALHYIDFIQKSIRDIIWGKRTRVILDVGCGVASFGGYLFERDVLAMSFAPKDEHEAQVQFALERGIPAISAVMGSQRLPFPSNVFDVVHCARCRVPWHVEGGTLLLEVNRVLRPGGYFVWSATPVYQKLPEDVEIWKAMRSLTASMCWELVTIKKDRLNSVGNAFFRKPTSNECYDNRKHHSPPMCKEDDDPNAAWYIPFKTCMHRVPVDRSVRGSQWPKEWPERLQVPPYWLNRSQMGVYGRPAPNDFTADYEHWKRVVSKSYLTGLGINWGKVRNVMDMRAVYGGFAAALKDLKVWVMNIVNIDDPDTLPIIYERGLFGIYHDWCETFSTYPRSYDLLHADRLFSRIKKRCKIVPLVAEVDRIVRPGGKVIIRDDSVTISEVEGLLKSLHWEVRLTFSKDHEGMIFAEKTDWRPEIEKSVDSA